jgi:exosortase/archaeosortase family protein
MIAAVSAQQIRFAVTFGVIAALLLTIYAFPYGELGLREDWFAGYLAAYARLVGRVLGLVDGGVRVEGAVITGRYSLQIVKTCDAMEANALFAAAVLATPGPWARKLGALGGGLVALVALNVIRICSLYYIGASAPGAFQTLHEDVWPLALIVAACGEFVLLAEWIRRGEGQAVPEPG